MRISDWSSDVCSSDLRPALAQRLHGGAADVLLCLTLGGRANGLHQQRGPRHRGGEAARIVADRETAVVDGSGAPARAGSDAGKKRYRRGCHYLLRSHRLRLPHANSEEPTSELQSLMRISYAVFCWQK